MILHSVLCRTSTINLKTCFLYGDTGVGKTFLSHCIARELLRSTHCVLYFSAYDLFDMMAANSFSRKDTGTDEELIYDCDLLIIDDLGTELTNSFVSSQLFLCLNERIMRRKSTIISTNLTLKKFLGYLFRENIFPNCQQLSDDIADRERHPYTENIFRRKLKWHR